MDKRTNVPADAACVEDPTKTGPLVPVSATVIVVIVLLLTAALTAHGMPVKTIISTLAAAGLLGIELVRRLVEALTARRIR